MYAVYILACVVFKHSWVLAYLPDSGKFFVLLNLMHQFPPKEMNTAIISPWLI